MCATVGRCGAYSRMLQQALPSLRAFGLCTLGLCTFRTALDGYTLHVSRKCLKCCCLSWYCSSRSAFLPHAQAFRSGCAVPTRRVAGHARPSTLFAHHVLHDLHLHLSLLLPLLRQQGPHKVCQKFGLLQLGRECAPVRVCTIPACTNASAF